MTATRILAIVALILFLLALVGVVVGPFGAIQFAALGGITLAVAVLA